MVIYSRCPLRRVHPVEPEYRSANNRSGNNGCISENAVLIDQYVCTGWSSLIFVRGSPSTFRRIIRPTIQTGHQKIGNGEAAITYTISITRSGPKDSPYSSSATQPPPPVSATQPQWTADIRSSQVSFYGGFWADCSIKCLRVYEKGYHADSRSVAASPFGHILEINETEVIGFKGLICSMIYSDLRLPTIKLFKICKRMPSPHLVDALPGLLHALLPVLCESRHDQEGSCV